MDFIDVLIVLMIAVSTFSLLFLLFIQVWLSNRFLKHPGQLFFFSCIFLLIDTIKDFTYIANTWNTIESQPDICISIGFISSFAYFMQFNYIAALSLEIIIKSRDNANQKHNIRMIIYHIYSVISSVILCVLTSVFGKFGRDIFGFCSIEKNSIGEKMNLVYIFFLLPIMWFAIFLVFFRLKHKKMAFRLSLVILCFTFDWVFGRFFPSILSYFGKESDLVYKISTFILISSGFLVMIARLFNKNFKDEIIEKYKIFTFTKKKINLRRKMKSGELSLLYSDFNEEESGISINMSDFAGDVFENITKKVRKT